MATREPVVAVGDFPIEAWEDVPIRDALWWILRDRAAHIAAERPNYGCPAGLRQRTER